MDRLIYENYKPALLKKSNIIDELSYFWKLKPNFIKKSNIINKIRCILSVDDPISEN
jgi:hypothetical protein